MARDEDEHLDKIVRRNKEEISKVTGYDFNKVESERNDSKEWFWHIGSQELTDPEGLKIYDESFDKRKKQEEEGDGWYQQPNWRG